MADEVVIFITASSPEEGEKIAQALVNERLAACVNVAPGVRSFFFWDGKTQVASECLLICKSRLPLLGRLMERVKALHSYTVPEIIAMPVIAGLPAYLDWVRETVKE